ncbi:Zinc-type alcohol dehydrogenase-like protein C16A3.02c like [Verticillium longisporum]
MALEKDTCRASQVTQAGNINQNLKLVTIPRPTADSLGKRDLLIQVISASVYKADYFPVELGAASRLTGSFPRTPGVEFSGRVVAVGRKVVDVGPGEVVFGRLNPVKPGSLAEYVVAPYEGIAVLPASVSPRLAGAAGTSSLAAYQSIAPYVQAGDKVFINGGSFAIQVAKALACHVTVTCSTDKIGLCQSLGADEVIDYKKVDVMNALYQEGKVFAHVVDNVVGSPSTLFHPGCRAIMLPGRKRYKVSFGGGLNGASWANSFVGNTLPSFMGGAEHKWKPLILENSHADLAQIAKWMEEGKLKTMIDSTFAFEEVPEAFNRLKKGSMTGKVVIHIQPVGGEGNGNGY